METSTFFVSLLWSWAVEDAEFAIDISRLTALSIRRRAGQPFQRSPAVRKVRTVAGGIAGPN
jgi:hypothetical protein